MIDAFHAERERVADSVGRIGWLRTKDGYFTPFKVLDISFHYGKVRLEGVAYHRTGARNEIKDASRVRFDIDLGNILDDIELAHDIVVRSREEQGREAPE